ncbi:MAG: hypothetical protein COA84_02915 [Robiginitomaculum sp.]|nr:MAG: hypothetical protein COA84_02915 [Robiginitomaculum sp.]
MPSSVRYIVVVIILIFAGVFGWLGSKTQRQELNANKAGWQTPALPDGGREKIEQLRKQLLATSYFADSIDAQKGDQSRLSEEDAAQAAFEKEYGRFPHIISISRINGRETAQLRIPENMVLTVHAGDVLESGWTVKEINSDHLVAEAGSERFSFAVFEHKNKPPQEGAKQ